MYYHLKDHIYLSQFRDEFILLDTQLDKYTVCFKFFSELLPRILEEASSKDAFSTEEKAFIQILLDQRVIEKKNSPYQYYIDRKLRSNGVSNVDWRLPIENKKNTCNLQVLNAIYILIKINFYMKFRGLYQTIQFIKNSRSEKETYRIPKDENLRDLAVIVNKACLIYPTRIKCLEWAMVFVSLALKYRWKCNLEIGVQNYPFCAHAWVECDGKVVMDSQDLRKGLAIILNEPFRREK